MSLSSIALCFLFLFNTSYAIEGMFLPLKGKIPVSEMKSAGFSVSEDDIVNMSKGGILHYSNGCSATFQSPNGLFGTNHHCAQGYCVEDLSVEQKNKFQKEGFIASNQNEEIKCHGNNVRVLKNVSNVSKDFVDLENSGKTFDKKFELIDQKMKKMVDTCENKQKTKFCKVAVMDNEKEPYYLYEFDVLNDIRLVWYPPDSLGAFGGDTDNWEYPRFSVDFSYLRAYKDGKPYESRQFAHTSAEGVKPGDPLFIVGFPGNTDRNITSIEDTFIRDLTIPMTNQVYTEFADILRGNTAYNQALPYFLNYKKNTDLKGDLMDRFKVIENKRAQEVKIPDAKPLIDEASKIIEKKYAYAPTYFMLRINNRFTLAKSLSIANEYVDAQKSAKKHKKTESAKELREDFDALKSKITDLAKNYDVAIDLKILAYFFQKLDALTVPIKAFTDLKAEAQSFIQNELKTNPPNVKNIVVQRKTDVYRQIAQYLLSKSTLVQKASSISSLEDFDRDRMVQFSKDLKSEFEKVETTLNQLDNQLNWYNRKINIQLGVKTPDANQTMRFTLGSVQKEYHPLYKKGVYGYSTYLTGMKARNGFIKDPANPDYPFFQMPKELLNIPHAVELKSAFVDHKAGSIPVNFISDNVITGGNSGSGVFNRWGELVGYAFDGTPESVLGDLSENPESRTILFDIRMVGFLGTDVYPKARPIVQELGLIK